MSFVNAAEAGTCRTAGGKGVYLMKEDSYLIAFIGSVI
jgi:hypothetical protein